MENFKEKVKGRSDIEEVVYEEALKSFGDRSLEEKKELASSLFLEFCKILESLEILDAKNAKAIISGVQKALTKNEEDQLYKLLYESEKIKKDIEILGNEIKDGVYQAFLEMESEIKNSEISSKDKILLVINEEVINVSYLKDVIREVSQSVFLSIIESGDDVKDTAKEFSKNLIYKTINQSEFKKHYALEMAVGVMNEAVIVANLSKTYAKDLIDGAINGVREGLLKATQKVKSRFKFAPDELNEKIETIEPELLGIEDEYVLGLKSLAESSESPAKEILGEILEKDYESYLARLKRASFEASQKLKSRLEEMEIGDNYKEFSKFVGVKFDEIKKELGSKSSKFVDDFELSEKLSNFKKELETMEKKISSKFSKKDRTKELADRAYEASKDKVKEKKEEISKDSE